MLRLLTRLFRRAPAAVAPTPPPPAPVRGASTDAPVGASLLAAVEALNAGRRDDAIARLKDTVERHPDAADAQLMLGRMLHDDGEHDEARDCYLLASAHRPDWSAPFHQLGMLAFERERWSDAVAWLRKAIELAAPDARMQNVLGAAYLRLNDSAAAESCFRAALALDPELAIAHNNLGYTLFKNLERYDEGEWHIRRAVELAPDDTSVLCNLVMVLQQRARYKEALALAERLLKEEPTRAEVRLNRGLMRLSRRDFGAWPDYEARRQMPEARKSADLPWPNWDGSSLAGKTIYVYREQGIGDEMMFASCLPEVISQARRCFIECSPKLAPLFTRSFPGATVLLRDEWREAEAIARSPPDCKSAIGSLPLFLRRSAAAFPRHTGYLSADPQRVERWKAKLATLPGRSKVGISWRGGLATTRRSHRSIPLEMWLPILSMPDIDFVSLQYGDVAADLELVRRTPAARLTHWPQAIDDYEETAALVAALDLVVSVQTAAVHLAGALGRQVIALIPAIPEWRYGVRGDSMIWYPSVRLLRQSASGDWAPVLEAARADIAASVPGSQVT